MPATYVLQLDKPLLGSRGLSDGLEGVGKQGAPLKPGAPWVGRVHAFEAVHRYTINDMAGAHLHTIHRIAFTTLARLAPILQLLRQQHVFNTLVQSCREPLLTDTGGDASERAFEVTLTAPYRIYVTGRHPMALTLISLEMRIAKGGVVTASLKLPGDDKVLAPTLYALIVHRLGA